jgi:hypothetical protein
VSEDGSKVVESAGPRKPPSAGIGRKKGVPNKATKAVKEALQEAFEGLGGVPSLIAWAKEEPTEFYKLWSKIMPTEVKAEVTNIGESPVGKIQIEIISANPEHQGN